MIHAFPHRTWHAIKMKAKAMKIKRETYGTPSLDVLFHMSMQDYTFMQEHGMPDDVPHGHVIWKEQPDFNFFVESEEEALIPNAKDAGRC